MNRTTILSFILVIALFTALSCKDERPVDPQGTWMKYSTEENGELLGTLELKESSLFVFTASAQGHKNTDGRYSLTLDGITFEDDSCYSVGTYSYNLSNSELTFIKIKDDCGDRVKVLAGTWTKSS